MTDLPDRLYEQLLVLRCQAGNRVAFAEIVARYQSRLRYFLLKLLGDKHCADDLLQDVWLEALRGLPRLAEPRALAAWLYRIAHDRAMQVLRKRRLLTQPLETVEIATEPEDESAFSDWDAGRVHAALDLLAPQHREVLVLRFMEEMSYEQIAQVVGCQVGTVKSRLHYAKGALRTAIERTIAHE
jgi:RNA polymerase sigma-70 factor (ECF subfamily)